MAKANPDWFRAHDRKRQHTPKRRAQKADSERKCRQTETRKAARAAERRTRQAALLQRVPAWADLSAIKTFYVEARRLTQETGTAHHVDHIFPLCGKEVSGLHVATNLQVIPATINLAKGSRLH